MRRAGAWGCPGPHTCVLVTTRLQGLTNLKALVIPLSDSRSVKREHSCPFDRDLTVTGVNIGEQPETPVPGIWLEKADI